MLAADDPWTAMRRYYSRVVVPWGALHLPAIEAAVLERGEVASHRPFHWRGIATKLVDMLGVGGGAGN